MHKLLKSKKRGATLIMAMLAIALLLIIGTGLLTLGLNSHIFSLRASSQCVARAAADAGLTKAYYEMSEKLKVKPWDGNSLPLGVNQTLPNCSAIYSYTVTGDLINGYTIESIGTSGNAERTVQCTLKLHGPFEYAIFGNEDIELKNSAVVDWYNYGDDDENMKVGTNSIVSGAITLKNSATINGDVVVGPGGDPDDVIELQNGATITGETLVMPVEHELPPVIISEWLQELPSGGNIEDDTEIFFSGKYDGIDLGNSDKIVIKGDVTLYIVGDVILGNSAEIVIEENTSLVLYVGGRIEGKNSSAFNNEVQDPHQLKIYGLDSCNEMIFKNSSEFYGAIYAPNADVIFHNSADAYGSVIVKSFELKNSAKFYYDASLRENVSEDDQALIFTITKWHEN